MFSPQSSESKDNLTDLLAVQLAWRLVMAAGWSRDKSDIKISSRPQEIP